MARKPFFGNEKSSFRFLLIGLVFLALLYFIIFEGHYIFIIPTALGALVFAKYYQDVYKTTDQQESSGDTEN